MTEPNVNLPSRLRFGLAIFVTLLAVASVAAYFSVRDSWAVAARPDGAASAQTAIEELELPPGQHRAEFQTSCATCHSPRLAFNQPTFPREKWDEIVHKMVAVYGAPITPDAQAHIAEYLTAAQTDR